MMMIPENLSTRLKTLETLVLTGRKGNVDGTTVSIETLLDLFIVLHDESLNSSLKNEKRLQQFNGWAKPYVKRIKDLRLAKSDFEIIKIIGRGAFGEVALAKLKKKRTGVGEQKVYRKLME